MTSSSNLRPILLRRLDDGGNTIRFVAFSDAHFNAWASHSVTLSSGINSRLQDGLDCLQELTDYVVREHIPLVVFCGDLFHTRGTIQVRTFNETYNAISELARYCTIILIPGNHDQANREGDVHSIETIKKVGHVLDTPSSVKVGQLEVCGHPFTLDVESLKHHIIDFSAKPGEKVLILHQGVAGGFATSDYIPPEELGREDLRWWDFKYVLLGHYHQRQYLGYNSLYVGSFYAHNFNDVGQAKGFLDVDTSRNIIRFIPTHAPTFQDINWKLFVDGDPETWSRLRGNIVRVTVPHGVGVDEVKTLLGNADVRGIVSQPQHELTNDIRVELSPSDPITKMIEDYVNSGVQDACECETHTLIRVGQEIVKEMIR